MTGLTAGCSPVLLKCVSQGTAASISISIIFRRGRAGRGLFNEELGAVVQLAEHDLRASASWQSQHGLKACVNAIGRVNDRDELAIRLSGQLLFSEARHMLQRCWSETSYHMQALQDNSDCAQEEFDGLLDVADPGLHAELTFDPDDDICAPFIHLDVKPKVAVLRGAGVNSQIEMAGICTRRF